ncbi:DUF2142 domain-containing protein [Granulicella cerasi]|uniref:DUF2142 domain-containing protein n=1 Tax=Granulicella cerasi TaxID=741063 RepID=A0ABW1ZAE8_9BACT|nr:DUF2142 domain-containing protein [Granulicella cerasi]
MPTLYLLVALFVGAMLCWITPPLYTPDETAHVERALGLLQGHWMLQPAGADTGSNVNDGVNEVGRVTSQVNGALGLRYAKASQFPDGRFPLSRLAEQKRAAWSATATYQPYQNTAIYPPTLYLPQLAGWFLGQHLHLSVVTTLRLARLCNVLLAVGLGWLALTLAKCWRPVLFCVLLLPTVLSLNASCSQDALLLVLATLAMSILSRALVARRQQTFAELAVTVMLLCACAAARVPYVMLLLALWLPVMEAETASLRDYLRPVWTAAPFLLAIAVWQHATHPIGLFLCTQGCDVAAQTAHLKSNPVMGLFWLVVATLKDAPGLFVKGFGLMGINDVFLPSAFYLVLMAGCVVMLLATPSPGLRRRASRLLVLFAVLVAVFGISLAQYLATTPVGSHLLIGVQSRYYLPFLPFLFLLWRGRGRILESPIGRGVVWVFGVGFLVVVLSTPWIAAHRFYATGILAALR